MKIFIHQAQINQHVVSNQWLKAEQSAPKLAVKTIKKLANLFAFYKITKHMSKPKIVLFAAKSLFLQFINSACA